MTAMVQVHNLSVHYGPIPALQGISLSVSRGECLLVSGPSGCGKSTLSRVLAGLIPHAIPASVEGSVNVCGLDPLQCSIPETAKRVGMVFQNPAAQLFHLSVEEEVAFGPRNLGLTEGQIAERVQRALQATGLQDLRRSQPAHLSGGQKQRLAIAAVLAMQPQVLVLDEPAASLDVPGINAIVRTLKRLKQRYGLTIVLIEHRLAEVAWLADRAVILDRGQVAAEGPVGDVLRDRQLAHRLGLRRPVDNPLEDWERLLLPQEQAAPAEPPLIEFHGVSVGYRAGRKKVTVLKNIDLALYPGEYMALVGHNGAGKSTLGLVAAGLLKPWQGKVVYGGQRSPRPGIDASLLFQNPVDQLFMDQVGQEVAFGPQNYGCFDPDFHKELLEQAGLEALVARRPAALSTGQQQRTALAACLALRPRLIVLDEPTLGQDWGHLERLMDFLAYLNRQGATILLITHDYKLVYRYAQRVLLIEDGQIALDGRIPHNKPPAVPIAGCSVVASGWRLDSHFIDRKGTM